MQKFLAFVLSLWLGLFILVGFLSALDGVLVVFFAVHLLTGICSVLSFLSLLLLLLVYGLMGLTPIIPKRLVVPVVLFTLAAVLVMFPVLIYHRDWMMPMDLVFSLLQLLLGLGILWRLRGRFKFSWPIVEVGHLGHRVFSVLNLLGFLLLNFFVLLPAVALYLACCAGIAASHYTQGFISLRPRGVILQARKYARDDGKTVLLFPMSHIAEKDFYQAVSQSASSNSIVLLEGVSDSKHLLTNGISYRRAAKSLGLAEQHDALDIRQGRLVRADVDVEEFSPSTIAILNLVGLLHAQGLNVNTLLTLAQFSPPPAVETQLFTDVLVKRNEHLLKELREHLSQANDFVIPWGAVHMPGLADEIKKSGFHVVEARDYVSVRFGPKRRN